MGRFLINTKLITIYWRSCIALIEVDISLRGSLHAFRFFGVAINDNGIPYKKHFSYVKFVDYGHRSKNAT